VPFTDIFYFDQIWVNDDLLWYSMFYFQNTWILLTIYYALAQWNNNNKNIGTQKETKIMTVRQQCLWYFPTT